MRITVSVRVVSLVRILFLVRVGLIRVRLVTI